VEAGIDIGIVVAGRAADLRRPLPNKVNYRGGSEIEVVSRVGLLDGRESICLIVVLGAERREPFEGNRTVHCLLMQSEHAHHCGPNPTNKANAGRSTLLQLLGPQNMDELRPILTLLATSLLSFPLHCRTVSALIHLKGIWSKLIEHQCPKLYPQPAKQLVRHSQQTQQQHSPHGSLAAAVDTLVSCDCCW
jgi:hypothetical protein